MKYLKGDGDTLLPVMKSTYFFEIDEKGMVTRQVEMGAGQYLWGEWNGTQLVGYISDQPLSDDEIQDNNVIEIGKGEFEGVWKQAREQ